MKIENVAELFKAKDGIFPLNASPDDLEDDREMNEILSDYLNEIGATNFIISGENTESVELYDSKYNYNLILEIEPCGSASCFIINLKSKIV